jgi:hypothetical protein
MKRDILVKFQKLSKEFIEDYWEELKEEDVLIHQKQK